MSFGNNSSRGVHTQQTRDVGPMLVHCWPTVYHVGPTVKPTLAQRPMFAGYNYGPFNEFGSNQAPVSPTLSTLNLPLSYSSSTGRELLSQFSTCSEWIWLEVGDKWTNDIVNIKQFHANLCYKTPRFGEFISFSRDAKWCFDASWGLEGLEQTMFTQRIMMTHL